MLRLFFLFTMGCLFNLNSAQAEKISLKMTFTGDLNEVYQFDGFTGKLLEASTENQNPVCKLSSTFRLAQYRNQKSIEAWLRFVCTIEGQTTDYRPHRLFLDPKKPEQTLKLPAQSEKLKKIVIQVSEFEVKSIQKK